MGELRWGWLESREGTGRKGLLGADCSSSGEEAEGLGSLSSHLCSVQLKSHCREHQALVLVPSLQELSCWFTLCWLVPCGAAALLVFILDCCKGSQLGRGLWALPASARGWRSLPRTHHRRHVRDRPHKHSSPWARGCPHPTSHSGKEQNGLQDSCQRLHGYHGKLSSGASCAQSYRNST